MTEQSKTEHSADEVRTRPFADVLRDLNKGRTHLEISAALQDLVMAVAETQKAGTLTLVIKVGYASTDMVVISDEVKVKKPENRAASLFFLDDHGNVLRDNPQQDALPLMSVAADGTQTPLRKAD